MQNTLQKIQELKDKILKKEHIETAKNFDYPRFFSTASYGRTIAFIIITLLAVSTIAVSLVLPSFNTDIRQHAASTTKCAQLNGACVTTRICSANCNKCDDTLGCGSGQTCCDPGTPKTCTPSTNHRYCGINNQTCDYITYSDCSTTITNCHIQPGSCGAPYPTPTPSCKSPNFCTQKTLCTQANGLTPASGTCSYSTQTCCKAYATPTPLPKITCSTGKDQSGKLITWPNKYQGSGLCAGAGSKLYPNCRDALFYQGGTTDCPAATVCCETTAAQAALYCTGTSNQTKTSSPTVGLTAPNNGYATIGGSVKYCGSKQFCDTTKNGSTTPPCTDFPTPGGGGAGGDTPAQCGEANNGTCYAHSGYLGGGFGCDANAFTNIPGAMCEYTNSTLPSCDTLTHTKGAVESKVNASYCETLGKDPGTSVAPVKCCIPGGTPTPDPSKHFACDHPGQGTPNNGFYDNTTKQHKYCASTAMCALNLENASDPCEPDYALCKDFSFDDQAFPNGTCKDAQPIMAPNCPNPNAYTLSNIGNGVFQCHYTGPTGVPNPTPTPTQKPTATPTPKPCTSNCGGGGGGGGGSNPTPTPAPKSYGACGGSGEGLCLAAADAGDGHSYSYQTQTAGSQCAINATKDNAPRGQTVYCCTTGSKQYGNCGSSGQYACTASCSGSNISYKDKAADNQCAINGTKAGLARGTKMICSVPASSVALSISLPAIGTGEFDNHSPKRTSRPFTIAVYDATADITKDKPLFTISHDSKFGSNGKFANAGHALDKHQLLDGDFQLTITAGGYLTTQLLNSSGGKTIHLTEGKATQAAPVTMTPGDFNADNVIDIKDYNAFIGCYGSKAGTSSCVVGKSTADLNDNGNVDGVDYNLWLRSYLATLQH